MSNVPTSMFSILVLEDDLFTSRLLSRKLKEKFPNCRVCCAFDLGSAVQQSALNKFSLMILDLRLPSGSVLDAYDQLTNFQSCPVIIYTGSELLKDEISSLNLGVSDFVLKSRGVGVLIKRVELLLGDVNKALSDKISIPFVSFDSEVGLIINKMTDDSVTLTLNECVIFNCLVANVNQLVARDELAFALEGVEYDGWSRKIDLSVSRLRRKVNNLFHEYISIKSVRGKGYILDFKSTS